MIRRMAIEYVITYPIAETPMETLPRGVEVVPREAIFEMNYGGSS
jgi:hypothetical protein